MEIDTGQFNALAEQVEQLAREVAELRTDACTIRTLEEMMLRRGGAGGSAPPWRPRHLRTVGSDR
jgi:hypothetical protein